jgi:hypothetical protein
LPFPDWFPGGCPTADTPDAAGKVYRIVDSTLPANQRFRSHHELGTAPNADPCRRCAVSVFNSPEGARHRQRLSPRLGDAISEGTLTPESGKTRLTNATGHISWWPYEGIDRVALFEEPKPVNS